MDNLNYYNLFREVPKDAQKTIQAGKLKGFTDINPMWRIKKLTEAFGACGQGWQTANVKFWSENAAGETAAFCTLELMVKTEDGTWSAPIFGIGGSKLSGKGVGDGINDEAYKMAYTDALSIACKNLGMAADIYYANDRTKYNSVQESRPAPKTGCSTEQYWKIVEAYAKGIPTRTGGDYRTAWAQMVSATSEMLSKFDHDVANFKTANNI